MLSIAIVGHARHALEHLNTLRQDSRVSRLICYHPTKRINHITNNFLDVVGCDGVIISSPTRTHLFYIRLLCKHNYTGAVYLEKPGFATIEESKELHRLAIDERRINLMLGYQYPYTDKIRGLRKVLADYPVGDPIKINITTSKGISYRSNFHLDWRALDKTAISHTLSCHHLSIYDYLFSEYNILDSVDNFSLRIYQNRDNGFYDCVQLTQACVLPVLDSLNSWGSPYIELDIIIHCRNAVVTLSEDTISAIMPRDCFDDNGNFCSPPKQTIATRCTEGLANISKYFIDTIENGELFSRERLISDIKIGQICLAADSL